MSFERDFPDRNGRLHEGPSPTRSTPGKRTLTEALTTPRASSSSPESELVRTVGSDLIGGPPRGTIESMFGGHVVQRKSTAQEGADAPSETNLIPPGGGRPLDATTRAEFEPRFGSDLGGVRVHAGPAAAQAASAVKARAFTVGQEVVFGTDAYAPATPSGRRLLAHELTHTVQQRSQSGYAAAPLGLSHSSDAAEQEADHVADRVVEGRTAGPILASPRGLSRQPEGADDEAGSKAPKVATGDLKSIPNWTYIAYRDQKRVLLRYYTKDVQVGTIPWITNNPGNLTVDSSQPKGSAQREPYAQGAATLGPTDTRYRRYAIFANPEAGVGAILPYLKKLYEGNAAADPTTKSMTLRQVLKIYKGKEDDETDDVKDDYVNEIKKSMAKSITEADPATTEEQASAEADGYLNKPFADVKNYGDMMLARSMIALMKEEGLGVAPGVEYAKGGFVSNTQGRYDPQQLKLIEDLKGSEKANTEIRALIGE